MKIERATIEEYIGANGIYARPRLRLDLDVRVLPKSLPAGVVRDHNIRVHGKKHSFLADLFVVGEEVNGPDHINLFYPGRPWFPVIVNFLLPEYQWYIPLDRARKEVAKHQTDWRIVPDDAFAVQGDLVWRLQEKELTCRARNPAAPVISDDPFCRAPATTEIRRHGYYVPLCPVHHGEITAAEASRRRGAK